MVRWKCMRKAAISRTQIWSQKIFAIQMWRKLGESDVTTKCKPYHDTICRCFVKLCRTAFNTETNNGALENGNESSSNLTLKKIASGWGDSWGWSDVTTGSKPHHHTWFECFDNLYRAVAYSETSEGAEHWRAGKLIMSRAQIWP